MIESFALFLLASALLLTILSFLRPKPEFYVLACVFWLVACPSVISVEVPYAVDNGSQVLTGTQTIYSQAPLAMLCLGMAVAMIVLLFREYA